MKGYEYIFTRQVQWALNQGIELIGSKNARGRPAYTKSLTDNLFENLAPEVKQEIDKADGNELKGTKDSPAKMHAVHSSSALGVNMFHYWKTQGQIAQIAAACGLCRQDNIHVRDIHFEKKYDISKKFRFAPNIDVIIELDGKFAFDVFAIECKFSEAYSAQHHLGLKKKYLELPDLWSEIPNLHKLAKKISPDDTMYVHLHPAQLIKHILGLRNRPSKKNFRLLYLWYDVPGPEGALHREEAEEFKEIATEDGIKFHTMTYQELIAGLANRHREEHEDYIKYMTARYL